MIATSVPYFGLLSTATARDHNGAAVVRPSTAVSGCTMAKEEDKQKSVVHSAFCCSF